MNEILEIFAVSVIDHACGALDEDTHTVHALVQCCAM